MAREQRRLVAIFAADVVGYSHAAYEQICYSSLMPRTYLRAAAGDTRLMATLYHVPTSRSLRVLWTLEEIGATVEVKSLGVRPRLHEPEYLAINPAGTLPAVIDGDRAIYESLAICEYLAAGVVPTWSWRRKSRSGRSSCNGCCTARRLCRRRSRR